MATITRVERRKRGIFGWLFLILFWAFQIIMAVALFAALSSTAEQTAALTTEAEKAGAAIGTVLGVGMIASIWASCSVILGIFVLLTRGRKTIIETTGE